MNANHESELSTLVTKWASDLTADEKVVIEAGHLTVKERLLAPTDLDSLEFSADAHCLLEAEVGTPKLAHEIDRGPGSRAQDSCEEILIRVPDGGSLDLNDLAGVKEVSMLDFSPTATEFRTLRRAVELAVSIRDRVATVQITILIGDLFVPPHFRESIGVFLPKAYQELLEEHDLRSNLVLLAESKCRNRGIERVKKRNKAIEAPAGRDKVYRNWGYTIAKAASGSYFLIADRTLGRRPFAPIALTKHGNRPTCAVIMAGKNFLLMRDGFDRIISIYDSYDDREIMNKLSEGMIISGCIWEKLDCRVTLLTLHTVGLRENEPNFVDQPLRGLRGQGRFSTERELLAELDSETFQKASQCAAAFCTSHKNSARQEESV